MLEPLNTEWNRKTGMLPGTGHVGLLGIKYGIVYFTWTEIGGSILYLQCDEAVFRKHFNFHGPDAEQLVTDAGNVLSGLQQKKAKFLKYPFEVV